MNTHLSELSSVSVPWDLFRMTPLLCNACLILPVALHLLLVPSPCSAAATKKCSSIYKGFAQCLLALGDSLSVSSQKDEDTQEIDSICKSWDDFHDCANVAMAGCPEEAAVVWESLRQESKKMQFSGNLYEMCSSRSQSAAASDSQSPDETNQESLKGRASHTSLTFLTFCLPVLLLFPWM
ncbi:neuritin-like protein [Carassius auratus]|uniref:Neuritin-like protein n=1 Tax=Carassius auratus TaxID=7957 RepID=A0A6P6LPY7_CARAU|nr:neuritin-like protein [Carassius auratus]XP_052387522.1 neuritin-like protein [Carassius gibelio]